MDAKLSGSNLVYILPKQPTTSVKPVIAALGKPLAKIAPLSAPAVCIGTPPLKPPKREREEDTEIVRCKRRLDFAKLGLPMHKQSPVVAARRNERERKRVKYINETFDVLKEHLPDAFQAPKVKNKEMSKVEILRGAIDYIQTLEELLTNTTGVDFEGEFAALIQASDSAADDSGVSFGASTSLYPDTPDPVTQTDSSSAAATPSGHSNNGTVMGNPESLLINNNQAASFPVNAALMNVTCTPSAQLPGTPSGHSGQSSLSGTPVQGQYSQGMACTPSMTHSRVETPSSSHYNFNIQVNHQNTPSQHMNAVQTLQMINNTTPSHHTMPQLIPSTQQVTQIQQNRTSYTPQQTFQKDQQVHLEAVKEEVSSTSGQHCLQTLPLNVKPDGGHSMMVKGDFNSNLLNNNNSSFVNNNTDVVGHVTSSRQPNSYTLNLDCGYMPNLNFTTDMPSPAMSGYTPSLCSPAPSIASLDKVTDNVDFTDLTSLLMGFD